MVEKCNQLTHCKILLIKTDSSELYELVNSWLFSIAQLGWQHEITAIGAGHELYLAKHLHES